MNTTLEQHSQNMHANGAYASINGLELYFETHGTGDPLILLHGGLGSTGMLADQLPQLAAHRQVIAVDLQAHGRTADIDRPLSLEAMGDDIGALIEYLNLPRADVMGYSMGGMVALQMVALQTAIRHPGLVRKLVVVSIPFKRNGWFPEVLEGMKGVSASAAEMMKPSPIYQTYASIAPRPEDWPALLEKMGEMMKRDYDYTEGVKSLKLPVLIVAGDTDSLSPAHAAEFFALLGGGKQDANWDGSGIVCDSRLAILPGTTHYNSFDSPLLPGMVTDFLEAPPVKR
jgi:pimeloyl-ACP methyl ester carboxylesterase